MTDHPDAERARQSNDVAGIVIDSMAKTDPDLFVNLQMRYGVADAIWEAGYRKAGMAVTIQNLEDLPVGSIVRHWSDERIEYPDGSWEQGAVAEKRIDASGQAAWFFVGKELGYRSHQADLLPAWILHRGGSM